MISAAAGMRPQSTSNLAVPPPAPLPLPHPPQLPASFRPVGGRAAVEGAATVAPAVPAAAATTVTGKLAGTLS